MPTLCFYHAHCPDGFGAAYAVWLYLAQEGRLRDAQFVPMRYGDNPPILSADDDVFIVDFSFPRAILQYLRDRAGSLVVIDHHQTAARDLHGLDFCRFDMAKSGAVLTWEYLFPDEPVPEFFLYLQDRDLWQWELPRSREFSAGLNAYPRDFQRWHSFIQATRGIETLQNEGTILLRGEQQYLKRAESWPVSMVDIGGYAVPCVNATHLVSELGNQLAEGHPFAAIYSDIGDRRKFSLRSAPDGVDVSEIAWLYGGGGHRHAAGFEIDKPRVL